MTYEQIVSKVKAKYADADASSLSLRAASWAWRNRCYSDKSYRQKCRRYFLHRSKRRQG